MLGIVDKRGGEVALFTPMTMMFLRIDAIACWGVEGQGARWTKRDEYPQRLLSLETVRMAKRWL